MTDELKTDIENGTKMERTLTDVDVFSPNFRGKATHYTAAGNRNFCVTLPKELAEELKAEGWNVKSVRLDEETIDFLHVYLLGEGQVEYTRIMLDGKPCYVLVDEHMAKLDRNVGMTCSIQITGYRWVVTDRSVNPNRTLTGVKTYLQSMTAKTNIKTS